MPLTERPQWQIERMAKGLPIGQSMLEIRLDFGPAALQKMVAAWVSWGCTPEQIYQWMIVLKVPYTFRAATMYNLYVALIRSEQHDLH